MNNRPRIGLNIAYLRPGEVGGGETYARGLLQGLSELETEFEFIVFANRVAWTSLGHLDALPNFQRILCDAPVRATARQTWAQFAWPALVKKYGIDLLHSLGNTGPMFLPCARVLTVHDLLYKSVPEAVPLQWKLFFGAMMPLMLRGADMVLSVSDFTASDLQRYFKLPDSKIRVTWEGPGQDFPAPAPWETVRQKYRLPEKFFLSVGTATHKRLDLCIEATRLVFDAGYDVPLVIAGVDHQRRDGGYQRDAHTIRVDYIPANELATLYSRAQALICSSQLEGFGLTILEAMRMGTPAIATKRGSVPEVMGNEGLLVDFGKPALIAEQMLMLLRRPELRRQLGESGRRHVERFSWRKCAELTLAAYSEVLGIPEQPKLFKTRSGGTLKLVEGAESRSSLNVM